VALAVLLGGCGGGSNPCDNPANPECPRSPSPPPAEVRTLLLEGSQSGLLDHWLLEVPFNTDTTGSIEATVDWTFASDDVDVYLVRGSCTLEQFNSHTCPFVVRSESTTSKPEKITADGQASGVFHLYIANWGPAEESVSYQIHLVTGGSAASASTTGVGRAGHTEKFVGMVSRP
jgi:hypothetical protein